MVRRHNRPWKERLKDLFAMHRGERRAFAVLVGLCIIAAGWVTWEQWIRPPLLADREQLQVVWASMMDSTKQDERRPANAEDDIRLFAFNPNGLPIEQWVALGLSERQAASIHRYEAHGGRFRTRSDLARMRVVDPDLYARWEPFIQLPDSLTRRGGDHRQGPGRQQPYSPVEGEQRPDAEAKSRAAQEEDPVELNTADSAALVAVRGIGPSFARAILRYRERLGGFHSLDQLAEVYILRDKPDAVQRLKQVLTLDPAAVKRIPINSCTVEELGPHPYMGWKVAKALVAYRDVHGPFRQLTDITGCVLVTDSIRDRMLPYLTLGN